MKSHQLTEPLLPEVTQNNFIQIVALEGVDDLIKKNLEKKDISNLQSTSRKFSPDFRKYKYYYAEKAFDTCTILACINYMNKGQCTAGDLDYLNCCDMDSIALNSREAIVGYYLGKFICCITTAPPDCAIRTSAAACCFFYGAQKDYRLRDLSVSGPKGQVMR